MRWQAAQVGAVVFLDLAVIWHWYSAPTMVVSRAALATAQGGGCREAMLLRQGGVDRFYLVDVASGKLGPEVTIGSASFMGGALTAPSAAAIASGQDLDTSAQTPKSRQPTLASGYASAVGDRVSWIGGPCMPLEDPLAARLTPAGSVQLADGQTHVYAGTVRYQKGTFDLFAQASVRIGIDAHGHLAFEALAGQVGAAATASTQVVIRFLPAPATGVGRLSANARKAAYTTYYTQLVHDLPVMAPAQKGTTGI